MVDADGATRISDVEQLEKALSNLAKDHVSYNFPHTHMNTDVSLSFCRLFRLLW